MDFEARKQKALAIMASRKMWKSNYAPPLIRLMWRLGINIPPLPFAPFCLKLSLPDLRMKPRMPVAGYRSHRMMMAGFWDLSTIPATDPSATGFVIPQNPDASASRRCPTPGTGKSQFPRSRRFLNTR